MMRYTYLLASALLLSSCALASSPDTGKANMVTLAPLPLSAVSCTRHGEGTLVVVFPLVPEELDTYRIAVLDRGRRDYLARMRWSGFLPGIIQSAFTQSLNNAGSFTNALSDDQIVSARWQLLTEVQRFEVVYGADEAPAQAAIEMRFELRRGDTPAIKKQFVLSRSTPIKRNNAEAIIEAFHAGFGALQDALIAKLAGCPAPETDGQ